MPLRPSGNDKKEFVIVLNIIFKVKTTNDFHFYGVVFFFLAKQNLKTCDECHMHAHWHHGDLARLHLLFPYLEPPPKSKDSFKSNSQKNSNLQK